MIAPPSGWLLSPWWEGTNKAGLQAVRSEKGATKVLIVQVHVHVKSECVEAFRLATLENAKSSVLEPGVARFDVLQRQDDPTRFVLVEVYRSPEDPAKHKETAHYQTWRDAVADLMAEPRGSVKYDNIFPEDAGW